MRILSNSCAEFKKHYGWTVSGSTVAGSGWEIHRLLAALVKLLMPFLIHPVV